MKLPQRRPTVTRDWIGGHARTDLINFTGSQTVLRLYQSVKQIEGGGLKFITIFFILLFTDSAIWAGLFQQSRCPSPMNVECMWSPPNAIYFEASQFSGLFLVNTHPPLVDLWTVPKDWTHGPPPSGAWSLKNKELFWIVLIYCPRMEPQKQGFVPDWTCGSSMCEALKRIGLVDILRVGHCPRPEP